MHAALRVDDWVEVRTKEEILRTLDKQGRLEGMPFMPEMFAFCGQRFRVYKRAHKTCDTVYPVRGRWLDNSVHLETRCDGSAHGGCQAGCLIFWKEAWLRPVSGAPLVQIAAKHNGSCQESDVVRDAQSVGESEGGEPVYSCQATRLPHFTRRLEWWDIRQYVEDIASGNINLKELLRGTIYSGFYNLSQAGIGLGKPMRWLYNRFHWIWRGPKFPRTPGRLPVGTKTPTQTLGLMSGELVRVKSQEEILETVTEENRNRGMYWDAELVPYCGGTYRVLKRVTQIIDEKTGRMQNMKNPCIILDDVYCRAKYSACRMFCPRAIYPYWREIWLERVETAGGGKLELRTEATMSQE